MTPRERPGRQKAVNLEAVEGMARVGAPVSEIAEFLGVSEALIRKKASAQVAKGRAALRVKLRQKQVEKAMGGNVTMLIWLGKQLLGQTDKVEQDTTVTGASALEIIHRVIDSAPADGDHASD